MIRSASEIRAAARAALSGKWTGAVIITFIYVLIMGAIPELANAYLFNGMGFFLQLILLPMSYSFAIAFLDSLREGRGYQVEQLFDGFHDFQRLFLTKLLVSVYTFLWSLLLLIPGIIKDYSYAMTDYVLKDHPEMKYNAAIERSMAMMKGHKFDLFYLHLTFIGWGLLSILTGGIGFFWLIPYMSSATAHFYEDVKAAYETANSQEQTV